MNLSEPPKDAFNAEGYPQLYALLKEAQDRSKAGQPIEGEEFEVWSKQVILRLRPNEMTIFFTPKHSIVDVDTVANLKKILWARKGIESSS